MGVRGDDAGSAGSPVELVGIYDADGGLRGELAYVVGSLIGSVHCSLCEITHSPVRRKPAWDRMAECLPIPIRLLHRNECSVDELAAATSLPSVVARLGSGDVVELLDARQLESCSGSVDTFEALVVSALAIRPPA